MQGSKTQPLTRLELHNTLKALITHKVANFMVSIHSNLHAQEEKWDKT